MIGLFTRNTSSDHFPRKLSATHCDTGGDIPFPTVSRFGTPSMMTEGLSNVVVGIFAVLPHREMYEMTAGSPVTLYPELDSGNVLAMNCNFLSAYKSDGRRGQSRIGFW